MIPSEKDDDELMPKKSSDNARMGLPCPLLLLKLPLLRFQGRVSLVLFADAWEAQTLGLPGTLHPDSGTAHAGQ